MVQLSSNGTLETQPFWDLGTPEADCPNWIARWFLLRQFRMGFEGIMRYGGANPEGVDVLFQPGEGLERRRRAEVGRSGMAFCFWFSWQFE